ncbi:MAG: dienelactone hydrolase family protein [Terrimesophilobacter sp.]
MTEIVLFHHALGLTPGIEAFANTLRDAGHTVHAPDLFEGKTFTTIEDGVGYASEVGFGEIMNRGQRAADALPRAVVYLGFSLGVLPAQMLAQTRAGALGAVLCYSCVPVSEFGETWPEGVPVQVHGMDADPFFADEGDLEAAQELVASTDQAELFVYPGDQHYFADTTLPSFRPEAAGLMMSRILEFLDRNG